MEKMDRRVRKTRALLLQGLVKMLETHDIQDISVKELTELVDINRGTFYLHYDHTTINNLKILGGIAL